MLMKGRGRLTGLVTKPEGTCPGGACPGGTSPRGECPSFFKYALYTAGQISRNPTGAVGQGWRRGPSLSVDADQLSKYLVTAVRFAKLRTRKSIGFSYRPTPRHIGVFPRRRTGHIARFYPRKMRRKLQ